MVRDTSLLSAGYLDVVSLITWVTQLVCTRYSSMQLTSPTFMLLIVRLDLYKLGWDTS